MASRRERAPLTEMLLWDRSIDVRLGWQANETADGDGPLLLLLFDVELFLLLLLLQTSKFRAMYSAPSSVMAHFRRIIDRTRGSRRTA